MNIKYQYNKIGKDYVAHQRKFFRNEEKVTAMDFILKNVPSLQGKTVLDFGCGHGAVFKLLEKKRAKRVFGIDVSETMIKEARKFLNQEKNLSVEDIQKTHFPKAFFDVVVGRFALHYLDSFDKAYKEISRILKPGGTLIFIVNHPFGDSEKKSSKNYWEKENIVRKLYKGKVVITYPTHTFEEYFSPVFLKYFSLASFEEGVSPEAQTKKTLPDYFAVKAVKK